MALSRRGFLRALAAVGGALLLPFRARATDEPTAVLTASQRPIKCGFCGQAVTFTGPEDAITSCYQHHQPVNPWVPNYTTTGFTPLEAISIRPSELAVPM